MVVSSWRWHHTNYQVLERDGLLYRRVWPCTGPGLDAHNPFLYGEYDLVEHGDSALLRFADVPGGDYAGECALGPRETSPVTDVRSLVSPLLPLPIPPGGVPTPARPRTP